MAFKLKSPFNNGNNKSKTPQADKYMKMNERVSKKPTITEKANYAMEGIMNMMTVPLTGQTVQEHRKKYQSEEADKKERAEARKSLGYSKSPVNAYMDDADASKLKQVQHSSSYTGPKNMITADGVNTQLTQDDKITTVGGDDPFSGYSKDAFKKKNEDDTPVPTDAEMKNTFDQFLFDNKEELDKLEQDAKDAEKRKQPLYPSEKVQKRRTTSMRNPKDQLVDVDKYRKKQKEKEKREQAYQATPGPSFDKKEYNDNPPFMMKKKQLTKTGAGKAHNMSALHYNQEQLMSSLSGAGDQPSQADLDAMKALLSLQNSEGMSSSPMNQNGEPGDPPAKREKKMEGVEKKLLTTPMTAEQQARYDQAVKAYQDSTESWIQGKGPEPMVPDYTSFKSPANNKDLKKMKRAAKKEGKAQTKAKRKAGTLDSSDFANQPYRTLKGKF
tara:strand:+ start:132 stop:1457 length:1326 start_codon:yes stop_codon:yes gene_type:complete